MKKIFLSFLLFTAPILTPPLFCASSALDELEEDSSGCPDAILDLDEDIDTEDPELIEILGSQIEEPSLLWTWVQTAGSSLLVHCMNAQRYMKRLLERMRLWWSVKYTKQPNNHLER